MMDCRSLVIRPQTWYYYIFQINLTIYEGFITTGTNYESSYN